MAGVKIWTDDGKGIDLRRVVRSRAPLRIGLAGGGTDLPIFFEQAGGVVVNCAIDRYAYCTVSAHRGEGLLCFEDLMNGISWEGNMKPQPPRHGFEIPYHSHGYLVETFALCSSQSLKISFYCEAPPGSGLGGSSALCVAILKALSGWYEINLEGDALAKAAILVERELCGFSGGWQDQYSASFGGINKFIFHKDRSVSVDPILADSGIINEFESSLILVDTGMSRNSADIIDSQLAGVRQRASDSLAAFYAMKEEAITVDRAIRNGDFSTLRLAIRAGWENKLKTSNMIMNDQISKVFGVCESIGLFVGKVSGAGGGGFAWLLVNPEERFRFVEMLGSRGFTATSPRITDRNAHAWEALTKGDQLYL